MRILVAEPSAIISWCYESVLHDRGDTAIGPVQSASEGLALAPIAMPLDLALAEVDLADGPWTGLRLARELRVRWCIPTLFFTTRGAAELPPETVALGLVQKPIMTPTLIASLGAAEALIAGQPLPERLPPGVVFFQDWIRISDQG